MTPKKVREDKQKYGIPTKYPKTTEDIQKPYDFLLPTAAIKIISMESIICDMEAK